MSTSSLAFTYKGRKTAWYVFKRMVLLLLNGEVWFKVNFSSPRECAIVDAAKMVGNALDRGENCTVQFKIVDGKVQSLLQIEY